MTSETPEAETPEIEVAEVEAPETDMSEPETPEPETPEREAVEAVEAVADEDDDAGDVEEDGDSDEESGEESAEDSGEAGGDDPEASDFDNLRLVEALLFASAEPLAPAQLARFLPDETNVDALLGDLEALYANRGVTLVKRGGRWAFRTAEDLAPRMELESKVVRKLSRVALETLAVIAYHQPVTRAEVEEIRGVALSKGTLDALLEIGWIRPKGRRKTPGRPVTWGTSDSFLDHFGLEGLDALPGVEELKAAGLLDARPALTALSDRGMLPPAGDASAEDVDEDDDEDDSESEIIDGSEQELLEETFGENLLPQEVDLTAAAAPEADGESAAADDEDEDNDNDNDNEEEGGALEARSADDLDAPLDDDAVEADVDEDDDDEEEPLQVAADDDAPDDAPSEDPDEHLEDDDGGDDTGDRRQRSAG
ncbi:MAG: SMC-Scp complex subunit ScpB [Kiloniellaceae bacterium]